MTETLFAVSWQICIRQFCPRGFSRRWVGLHLTMVYCCRCAHVLIVNGLLVNQVADALGQAVIAGADSMRKARSGPPFALLPLCCTALNRGVFCLQSGKLFLKIATVDGMQRELLQLWARDTHC